MKSLVDSTLEKVDHVIDRIHSVRRSSLLQPDAADALTAIAEKFQLRRKELEDFIKDPPASAVIANHCDIILSELFRYLPHIGFLHRARHPSNPFEVHGPLRRLATEAIGDDVRLIISSEWEFSPYTHSSMGDIPNFVLLGLPASEAENALLAPIAGHEFGHPIWKREGMDKTLSQQIERAVLDQLRARWSEVKKELGIEKEEELTTNPRAISVRAALTTYARAQCEEVFCDLLGLFLFGESYCHAFAHLLAPGLVAHQSLSYPTDRQRAEILEKAASRFGVTAPTGFFALFQVQPSRDLSSEILASVVADLLEELVGAVESYSKTRNLQPPLEAGRVAARVALEAAAPASNDSTLPEVLCAAWDLRTREDLWKSTPYLREVRERILNDLVLKSAQVLDYWHLVGASP